MTPPPTNALPPPHHVGAAAAPAQHIDLRTSAHDFFAMAQWDSPPLDLATETAVSVLAWL